MIADDRKPRRNDPCSCGSGAKYKKCCDPKAVEARKTIQLQKVLEAIHKSFFLIVDAKGPIGFSAEQLDSIPDNWMELLCMGPAPDGNGIIFDTVKKKGIIEVPKKRIII